MPYFEASSNDNKVASSSKSKYSNLVVQLVCLGGLLTFIPPTTPNLSKIQFFPNEEDELVLKNFFKTMMSLTNAKTYELHNFHR